MSSSTQSSLQIKYLNELNATERKQFFNSFDVVFCDCDGVVWYTLRDFIPGSAAAINFLQRQGKQLTFVTNNSICPVEQHLQKFAAAQLQVSKQQIVHPAQTICDYLKSLHFDGLLYCLASPPFKQLLRDAGFQLAKERDGVVIESLRDLRDAIYSQEKEMVRAVVIDVDFNLSAAKLMRARVYLQDANCLFIAGAADALIPFGAGDIIGPGAFIDLLAQSTSRQPTVLGKPGAELRSLLRQRHPELPPERVLFIGDSLTSDIGFARQCGYQTLLVLTGGSSAAEAARLPAEHAQRPDFIASCLGDLNYIV